MSLGVVGLSAPVILVPGVSLEGQLRKLARDHPGLPVDLRQLEADLNAPADGVATTFSEPRKGGGDRSLLVHTRTCVIRLFLRNKSQDLRNKPPDAYTIAAINPLRLRDHHGLAQGCLLLRPTRWQVALDPSQIPQGSDAGWSRLEAEWEKLTAGLAAQRGASVLTARQVDFLATLDRLIDVTERITLEEATARSFPYRDVAATAEQRYGTHAIYRFRLAGGPPPEEGLFVQVRGEPEQRGQVTGVEPAAVTVRFDDPVSWARIPGQGQLEVTASRVVFDMQRKAVGSLRARQTRSPNLLSVVVDQHVRPIRPTSAEPTEELDNEQLDAFRRAVTVDDMLLVLGPPGTGKTRTISQIAQTCANEGQRVLVTSHTNRAVDNVLGRLPDDLTAIRVGNDGKVTPEGRPYLLERRAAELRQRVINAIGRSLPAYEHIDLAAGWARELDDQLGTLSAIRGEQAGIQAGLAQARRAVGGDAQIRVDQLAGAYRKREKALARHRARAERLVRRRNRARPRAGWPLLGVLFRWLLRRCDQRLSTAQESGQHLRDTRRQAQEALEHAEQQLDAATRDDPTVHAARAAMDEVTQRRDDCYAAALKAAHACRAIVSAVQTPPVVRDEGGPEIAEQDLMDLRAWLATQLPLLAAQASLLAGWHNDVSGATDQLYPELIRYADVIAATCIGAASRPELSDVDFDLAIVDEAGQIAVTDVLVPLVRARRGVLVGDHHQLPPFLDSAVQAWGKNDEEPAVLELLTTSALELLVKELPATHVVKLIKQRRMPSVIADFISAAFYHNKLKTEVHHEHHDPLFCSAMAFVDTARLPAALRRERSGRDRERWGQPGYINPIEAELLTELAAFYHRRGAEWAIIVPYRAQVAEITVPLTGLIDDATSVALNVGTVDSFQGGEREVILYGFTRSNSEGKVGFLDELRRANVAFTRAKHQLVLLGDLSTLTMARDPGFRRLAQSLRDHVADRGDIRQYSEIRDRLAELTESAGGVWAVRKE